MFEQGCGSSVRLAVLGIAGLLVSCGGGEEPSQPNPPEPPAELQPLLLHSYDSGLFSTTFSFFDVSRSFALIGYSAYSAFAGPFGTDPVTFDCDTGGTITLSLRDEDATGSVTVGDRVTVEYSGCAGESSALDAVVHVDIQAVESGSSILSAAAAAAGERTVYAITIESFEQETVDAHVTMTGRLVADYRYDETEDHFLIQVEELVNTVELTDGSQTLTLRDSAFDYRLDYGSLRYSLELDGRIDVEAGQMRGYYSFATGSELSGLLNNSPDHGELTLAGADESHLRLEATADDHGGAGAPLVFHSVGGGDEVGSSPDWPSVYEPSRFAPLRSGVEVPVDLANPPDPLPLGARILDLGGDVGGMQIDAVRNRLYATVPQRNEVVVISTQTYQVIERIVVGSLPTGLSLSADGETLFVANRGGGTISAVVLGISPDWVADVAPALRTAKVFDVVEASGLLFASGATALESGQHGLLRVDPGAGGGVERAAGNRNFAHDLRLFADPAGQHVYGSEAGILHRFDANDAGAPLLDSWDTGMDEVFAAFHPVDGALMVGGSILNPESLTLERDLGLGDYAATRFSRDGDSIWAARDDGTLNVFEYRNVTWLASYGAGCTEGALQDLAEGSSPGDWILLRDSKLCVVSASGGETPPGEPDDPPPTPPSIEAETESLVLGGAISDFKLDLAMQWAYIALPGDDEIVVLDLTTDSVEARMPVPNGPTRLGLSADGASLYVFSDMDYQLSIIDTQARTVSHTVDLFGSVSGSDIRIVEAVPGRLVLGSDYNQLVQVRLDQGDLIETVDRGFPGGIGTVTPHPDGNLLYAVGSEAPFAISLVNMVNDQLPLLTLPDQYAVEETHRIEVGPGAARLYLSNGAVVTGDTGRQLGVVAPGAARVDGVTDHIIVAVGDPLDFDAPVRLHEYDPATFVLLRTLVTGCRTGDVVGLPEIVPDFNRSRWLIPTYDGLCVVAMHH